MKVAIIPARGGSKRIPRKNLKPFAGKPMIAHSIEAAIKSRLFDRILVSTDDAEIAGVSIEFGAEAPFVRPKELSDDFSPTHDVVSHALQWLLDEGMPVSHACCIYATAPLIQVEDIRKGFAILDGSAWKSVFAATTFAYPIFRAFKQDESGGLSMVFPQHFNSRSQDLPETFHDAGQFYWARMEDWLAPSEGFGKHATIVPLPRWRVQDIDTPEDWTRAEFLWHFLNQRAD